MDKPTASADQLMGQATETAKYYLVRAIHDVDELIGEGTAGENPALIAAYLNAAALDFHAASLTAGLWQVAEAIQELTQAIVDSRPG
jgi:hypothetical protein